KERVLDELGKICHSRSLVISLLPTEPQFCFRVHNASNPALARIYLRFGASGFIPWLEGVGSTSIWRSLPNYLPTDDQDQLFVWMKNLDLKGEVLQRFKISLNRALKRYFPGIEDKVRQLCVGPHTQ